MHDTKPQATAAGAAAAAMMWAWPLAAARVADAWAARGWTLWLQLLRPAAPPVRLLWPFGPGPWPAAGAGPEGDRTAAEPAPAAAAEPGFASYRSPGGHAAAQILRPD